ncbi:hypothetical protein QA596_02210 [Balneolales bacterium ANBcel1]|nr:hypothetical protein [Balneolales bacterium ANBcel1]
MEKLRALFVVILAITLLFAPSLQAQFSGGNGTPESPWHIATADDLNNMRYHLDGFFLQTADIDLGTAPWNEEQGWVPVGESGAGNQFTGHFDGNGHVIRNLTINRTDAYRQGLFGEVSYARLTNIRLENVDVHGFHYAGGLAGNINESVVEHCSVTGNVTSERNYIGGLAGSASSGSRLHNVHADVSVSGDSYVGGLIGSTSCSIRNAWSDGDVAGTGSRIGGLIGSYNAGSRTISDSYSHASVYGDRHVGGFIGYKQTGSVHRSFSTGRVTDTGAHPDDTGGFFGYYFTGSDSYCYWDIQTSGQQESAGRDGVAGMTTEEMQHPESYKGFNFYTLWQIDPGRSYPAFQDLSGYRTPAVLQLNDLAGAGTEDNPYLITSADELNAMRLDLEAHYRLQNDIDLASSLVWNNGDGWLPVGTTGSEASFRGSLDGNGFVIRNLTINRPAEHHQGLFGVSIGAVLKNIRLEDVQVHGANDTGGLTGSFAGESIIDNSSVTGQIISFRSRVGGLAGSGDRSMVHRVHTDVQVWANSHAGGLIGSGSINLKVRNASSVGQVEAAGTHAGGFIGHYNGSSQSISDSYSHASVYGDRHVGGFIGYKQTGTVHRSFSTGRVADTGTHPDDTGGFIGFHYTGNDSFCFWDTQASGQLESAGRDGIVGMTTEEMQQPDSFGGFNFYTLWTMVPGQDYPVFQDLSDYRTPAVLHLNDLAGAGTEDNPYLISSADELNAMRLDLEAHYRLEQDIDLSATVIWDYGDGWMPVGDAGSNVRFTGSLDGNGYVIRNLTINRPVTSRQGLFGETGDATLRNIHLEDVQIHGGSYTGGIAGSSVSGNSISDASVTGEIVSDRHYIGGIAGAADRGLMQRVFAVVDVWGDGSTGGLAGVASIDQEIHFAWTRGTVTGSGTRIGGLVGHYNGSSKSIMNSYSLARVRGGTRVGGFIGMHQTGNIHRSYSAGLVTGTGGSEEMGGFIGEDYAGSVFDSYWDTEASGLAESFGGYRLQGKPTEDMTWPYDEGSYAGWDFSEVWTRDTDGINHGYPYLKGLARSFHEITVYAEQQNAGTVDGGGVYRYGGRVMVTAKANEDWVFLHWSEDGSVISKSPSYTFTATSDRSLAAHFEEQVPTDSEHDDQLPVAIALSQNFPNPFNPATRITFALPAEAEIRLEVFDVMGRRIRTLASEHRSAGYHTVRFDASGLASGIYISRLTVRGPEGSGQAIQVHTRAMTLVK